MEFVAIKDRIGGKDSTSELDSHINRPVQPAGRRVD